MKRALISVANKSNLEEALINLQGKYEIISTGSTANLIEELGYAVTRVSEVINFEEILGGRVKTLHPNIHGGILSRRTADDHKELAKHDIVEIDVVICNLYPFEQTIMQVDVSLAQAIENIDIGGVTLLRAAAKNFKHVTIITDPCDYQLLANNPSDSERATLAAKAFEHTAYYDVLISNYLKTQSDYASDEVMVFAARKASDLRYGENSHQQASYYTKLTQEDFALNSAEVLGGKELSYNNIKDIDAALNLISEFTVPTAVALKHNTPCGIGKGENLELAFNACYEMDSVSIFGGIVVVNREITLSLAQSLKQIFLEVVIAPSFAADALALLQEKPNLRLLAVKMNQRSVQTEIISVNGGYLAQDKDQNDIAKEEAKIVTTAKCSPAVIEQAKFAQTVCKYVKSNAIVIANKQQIIAQAGGQTSRVDAAKIALTSSREKNYTQDLILASDAFLPFSDVVELASEYGVTTIIQPGGSIRDQEVIDKCNELGISMIMTKVRHFKH